MEVKANHDLISRAKSGDRVAFDEVVGPLVGPAYRLAFGLLHNRETAEDVVQEAALRAWRKINHVRQGSDIGPWFLAIVANQARTAIRGRWWSVLRLGQIETADPEGFEDRIARGADMRAALLRLSVDQREVLVLRYFLDLPLEEVAAITGVPMGTVKSRINRGIRALRPSFESSEVMS